MKNVEPDDSVFDKELDDDFAVVPWRGTASDESEVEEGDQ